MLTKGVHRDNLQLRVQRYRHRKLHGLGKGMVDEDSDKETQPFQLVMMLALHQCGQRP